MSNKTARIAKAQHGLLYWGEVSEEHNARIYEDRLAIWRKDGERLTWEELQQVKQMIWGDSIAVEVYPPQYAVKNLRHTRHLWRSDEITQAIQSTCSHPEFDSSRVVSVGSHGYAGLP